MGRTRAANQTLTVEGRDVPVSNLEKLLYPTAQFTKAQVIDYYIRIAPYLLPHLKDRPVTLKRYPDGIKGEHFYEKDAPSFTPDWVQTFPVPRRAGGPSINYILINDLPTLVWSANLANLEIHPFLHQTPNVETPTMIAFDLDPGEGADVLTCAEVSFLLKEVLDALKLKAFAKVSGSKGIQVYVPLNRPVTYGATQPFARAVAELLARQHPDRIVAEMAKNLRKGKVFIDWSQNADFKTTVGVYSLRAKHEHPYVSVPVRWEELHEAIESRDPKPLFFDPEAALRRCQELGDLFIPVLKLKQKLPDNLSQRWPTTPEVVSPKTPRSLEQYKAKRNFAKTPEPQATLPRRSSQGGRRRFVIQKHAASHLHYDFRLEMHHVLKSWAVPKGVPYTLDERRLAMGTEDHPIEYLDFEGTIPAGQYGGGTVMVWDIGTYELIEGNYYKGRLHLFLSGKKLKGEWILERDVGKGERAWVMRKAEKPMKPISAKHDNESALTGRTINEIAEAGDRVWQSNRSARTATPSAPSRNKIVPLKRPAALPDLNALPRAAVTFVEPMLAKLVDSLPESAGWLYEIKLDGYRALALCTDAGVRLLSRNNNALNARFPTIVKALETIEAGTILDGEVVALDEAGQPSFNRLQNNRGENVDVYYYTFDALAYRGKDLMRLPLRDRRVVLQREVLASSQDPIRYSETLEASAEDLIAAAREHGLEGVIAKRAGSVYEPGKRSGAWVKVKVHKGQELVIGGYRPGNHGFDNLAVGYYEGKDLIFNAKVRNGLTPEMKHRIAERFKGLEMDHCPFANLPEPKTARRGEALTREAMKKYRWLKPKLVAQVEFADWTEANHLRHSRFVALRDDVDPKQVRKERTEA